MTPYYEPTPASDLQATENRIVNTALTKQPIPYLSGLKLAGDIALYKTSTETELTFNAIDTNNVVWIVSDIEGWWNLPDSEVPDLPRGWGDGSYDGIGRWSNRLMTLNGSFLPQDPSDVAAARATLFDYTSNLVKDGGAGFLIVDEPDPADSTQVIRKATKVRLSGTPQITSVNARGRHDFSIGLRAVDPIKYEFVTGHPEGYDSTVISSTGSTVTQSVTNSGNIAVPVIFEMSAAFAAPSAPNYARITSTPSDQVITILSGTDADVKMEIDTYNREVLDVDYTIVASPAVTNARSKVSVLVDWIYLQPGENEITLTIFPAGSTCTVYYRSGWIG